MFVHKLHVRCEEQQEARVAICAKALPLLLRVARYDAAPDFGSPGRGADCFRTWEALALGSVPLVPRDEAFDARLHELGPAAIPPPAELTVEGLRAILDGLQPPAQSAVDLSYWEAEWAGHLATAAEEQSTLNHAEPRCEQR